MIVPNRQHNTEVLTATLAVAVGRLAKAQERHDNGSAKRYERAALAIDDMLRLSSVRSVRP